MTSATVASLLAWVTMMRRLPPWTSKLAEAARTDLRPVAAVDLKEAVEDVADRMEFLEPMAAPVSCRLRRFEEVEEEERLRLTEPSRARVYHIGLIIGMLILKGFFFGWCRLV